METNGGSESHAFRSERNPAFVIAEIGGNHEGDFEYAKKLTQLAVQTGVDAVKFQIYEGDRLVSPRADPERNAHFKRFELSRSQFRLLATLCREQGVQFMASVWDLENLEWVDELVRIHKVGSGDFTAFPILRRLVATGKPIVLSTGLCNVGDIEATLRFLERCDSRYISDGMVSLLQCTTSYPCPDAEVNLAAIPRLAAKFGVPVGYSDHTPGMSAALAAVTMGACIIEKHFTDTRVGKTFRDHAVSGTPEEFVKFLANARRVRELQGDGIKKPTDAEVNAGHVTSFRRSVFAARPIRAGEQIAAESLTILRPAIGIPASQFDAVVGTRARRDIEMNEAIHFNDIDRLSEQIGGDRD